MAGEFVIAEGVLDIDADTTDADRRMDGFFRDINGRLRDARGRFSTEGERAGKEYGDGLERGVGRGGFFSRLFRGIGSGISGGIGQLRELGSTLRDVGEVFSRAGGLIGGGLKLGLLAAAVPVIIGLAAALSKLIGLIALLPGVVGFAVAAIAPLIIAFKGMGEVLAAGMSGDMEKFNEGMQKLAPSARAVVREFMTLVPMLKDLQRNVQWAFFAPLVGHVKALGTTLLPVLNKGLTAVAGSLGLFFTGLLDLLRSGPALQGFNDLFISTSRIIDRLAPSVLGFFATLGRMMQKGLPFVERVFGGIATGLDKLSGFLNEAMDNGRFEGWLEGAFSVMKDLWELTKSLTRLFAALFGPTADEGQTFIQSLTAMTDKLTEFLKSAEGVEFLENLVALLRNSRPILLALASTLIFLMEANNTFVDAIAATVRWFRELDDVVGGWLSGAGAAISGWWNTAIDAIGRLGDTIATFVGEKAMAFGQWLINLPAMIHNGLVRAAEAIGFAIGSLIGQAVRNILDLPERARGGIEAFRVMVIGGFETVTQFMFSLPGRWSVALSALWSTVTGWFSRTRESAVSNTQTMSNQVVGWVAGLRQRVLSAIGNASMWLYNAGKDALRGLIQGFQDMMGWAVDRVRGFADAIVRGFRARLEARSPSQVMRREVGRTILPGVVLGMKDTMGSLEKFMSHVQNRITQPMVNVSAPSVSVGGTVLYADLGDGVARAVNLVAAKRPDVFAAATDEGRRQRTRQLGARAKV